MAAVKFKRLSNGEGLPLPTYQSSGAAGLDLPAAVSGVILPRDTLVVPIGFAAEVWPELEMQIRSRSGLAAKHGVFVLNSPGTIDSDYRGEIKVILHNAGDEPFIFQRGDRIAQAVLQRVQQYEIVEVDELSVTDRGSGGLGSTGT